MKEFINRIFSDEDRKEILGKGVSFLGVRFGGLLAGFLFTYFITKNYGASVYGLIALCFSLFFFFGILGRLGLDINIVRFYSHDEKIEETGLFFRAIGKSFFVSSLIALVLFFSRDLFIFRLFGKPELEPYFIWTALAIPFWSVALVCAGFLRARKQNNWFAFLNNPARFLFSLTAIIILYALADSPINAIKAHFIGVLIMAVIALIKCISLLKNVSFKTRQNSWKFVLESFPMMISSTLIVLLGWMDTFILGIFTTDDQIGIYGVALKVATLGGFIFQAINSILAPKLAVTYGSGNKVDFARLVRFATQVNFLTTLLALIGIVVFHKWLLSIFGPEFVAGSTALLILCLGQLITAFSGSVGVIMQMTGKQVSYQNIVIAAFVVNIVLNLILIPKYGIIGAAIASVLSILTWNLSCAIYIKKSLKIESYFNPFK